ncbi:recombinase family protein [Paeniroseomonas aquatica]|uniref:Recombinase family protein n=2 Tax=Paeniroseomonas aquatica TaxID=373043 RepID=A0ABT8AF97_9PROT|nr:recombinase family protein [Paeniroseomonas aquatica]MDN3568493.1 recombinase family protein [Paeniroseomonas aquatica]
MHSELITPDHLARRALIYIRQSTAHQVLSNGESTRLQYALRQRAVELGWHEADVDVIDQDLGESGTTAANRSGFKDLLARVGLGEVGIVLSYEVTRLTRNCSDWYPLLDLCGYRRCLIADRDGVYDPATGNGRLLLGLKGTISEVEMHTLRGRLTAGLLAKATRGELALPLPVGLERDPSGIVVITPDQEVEARLRLVFATFLERRSAQAVLRIFLARGLTLPRREGPQGGLCWRSPTKHAICRILTNPAYAGAFVYGRTACARPPDGSRARVRKRPRAEWRIVVPDRYPPYIGWDTYEAIVARLGDNHADYRRLGTRGAPRDGAAMLHGLVHCGACGRKMTVQYHNRPRYICRSLEQDRGLPRCQNVIASPIDALVVAAFLEAVAPAEVDAFERAEATRRENNAALRQAAAQQVERLRYRALLAERQFGKVDPDNRLVAAELERRWEAALLELRAGEEALAKGEREAAARGAPAGQAGSCQLELRAALTEIGETLPPLWADPRLMPGQRKALLRCLVDKVVLERTAADRVAVRVVWVGGDWSEFVADTGGHALRELSGIGTIERLVAEMARAGASDAAIVEALDAQGHHLDHGRRVLLSTIRKLRLAQGIRYRPEMRRRVAGALTLPEVAEVVGVSQAWLHHRIRTGRIRLALDPQHRMYLFPNDPAVLDAVRQLANGSVKTVDLTPNVPY